MWEISAQPSPGIRKCGTRPKRFASPIPSEKTLADAPPKVFRCKGLNAGSICNLSPKRLIESLAQAFKFYNGKDTLGVVVTGSQKLLVPYEFAGVRLPNGTATFSRRSPRQNLSRVCQEPSPKTAELNAAHLIVSFSRIHGPGFLRRMKGRRFERQRPKRCLNCCLLTGMENSRDLPY
jgi:hypothetical protein